MKRKEQFRRIRRRLARSPRVRGDLCLSVAQAAATWFAELADLEAIAVPLSPAAFEDPERLSQYRHPLCASCYTASGEAGGWTKHLAELRERTAAHWHRCAAGKLCAIVPAVVRGRCVAACKLVCEADMDEGEFTRNVELLGVLVERCVAQHAEALAQRTEEEMAAGQGGAAKPGTWHEGVQAAMVYVAEHLVDSKLSVRQVAEAVGMNSTYLGHLFAQQVGVPMHRYVAIQRVERAKGLLASTNWSVKRIAHGTGHGNADWFSHIFRDTTGVTPTAYRRRARKAGAGP